MEIDKLEAEKNQNLVLVSKGLPEILEKIQNKTIDNQGEYSYFCDILKKIKDREKAIDGLRTKIVKPLNDLVKQWNDEFRPAKNNAEKIRLRLNTMLSDYDDEQERLRQAEIKRLQAEQEKAEAEALKAAEDVLRAESEAQADEAIEEMEAQNAKLKLTRSEIKVVTQPVKPTTTEYSKTSFRVDIKSEITDQDLVPRKYCSPDSRLIDKAVKAGETEIPGVRIYKVKTPITR